MSEIYNIYNAYTKYWDLCLCVVKRMYDNLVSVKLESCPNISYKFLYNLRGEPPLKNPNSIRYSFFFLDYGVIILT